MWPWWDSGSGEQGHQTKAGPGCYHWGEPMVVTENSLFPCTAIPPGACTCLYCYWHPAPALITQCHQWMQVVAVPQLPLRASPLHPALRGAIGIAAATYTCWWCQPHSHLLLAPAPVARHWCKQGCRLQHMGVTWLLQEWARQQVGSGAPGAGGMQRMGRDLPLCPPKPHGPQFLTTCANLCIEPLIFNKNHDYVLSFWRN